jgi:IS5 family transposase
MSAKIEVKDGNFQITISVKEAYKNEDLKRFLDFQRVREITSRSKITDEHIATLADEADQNWWENNKEWFLDGIDH